MNHQICMHCYISGRVQGVWFRASTQKEAQKHHLTGWAKNLPDGRVEVMACGEKEKVNALYEWLQHGPTLSNVTKCTKEDLKWKDYSSFQIL